MNARDRRQVWVAVAAAAMMGSSGIAVAQTPAGKAKTAAAAPAPKTEAAPEGKLVRIPVKPTDAVAVVNGEDITRQELAEQALIQHGEAVLEVLVSRKLLAQAVRANKVTITQKEIEAEIDHAAATMGHGVSREEWLRALSKERNISLNQYQNDIIYPGLALRKLSEKRVVVTEQDLKDAFEAHYGEQLQCRIIMTMTLQHANAIYNELKKNPGGFAHIAQNDARSIDEETKTRGGFIARPLTRHAYPRSVSDAAFRELVDGDPEDRDPSHKPKDGMISGPIQVEDKAWVIMKRESVIPATPHDPKDVNVQNRLKGLIYEAKLKDAMSEYFEELIRASAVENRLTGHVKLAQEDSRPESVMDEKVQLMSDPNGAIPQTGKPATAATRPKSVGASVNPEDRAAAEAFKKAATSPGKAATAPK